MLPILDFAYTGTVTYDATGPDTHYPPITRLIPPAGAPNVLVILVDDVGFGASSAFGGPVQTPNFERVAAQWLKYTRFHTTALCSPTRAALLSGRNHHTVGMGGITEITTSAPGYNSLRPNTCAPLAETLKLNSYSTAQFGKCHEVPVWEASAVGPFDHWPHPGGGFEYFFGFLGGETNQWYPRAHFAYDGGGYGKGGTVTFHVDDKPIGQGRIERTIPFQFSFDKTVDVGCDLASPVSSDYGATGNAFTGSLRKLRIDLGDGDHSHLIDPEHRLQVAMLRQWADTYRRAECHDHFAAKQAEDGVPRRARRGTRPDSSTQHHQPPEATLTAAGSTSHVEHPAGAGAQRRGTVSRAFEWLGPLARREQVAQREPVEPGRVPPRRCRTGPGG